MATMYFIYYCILEESHKNEIFIEISETIFINYQLYISNDKKKTS